jgi:sterol desaturase/sphingolipid hydroxylase (fatty acid hydroxylase superfamily)
VDVAKVNAFHLAIDAKPDRKYLFSATMKFYEYLLPAGLSLLFLGVLFIPMEKVFAAKREQNIFRPHWLLDLTYFLGQYLFWGGLILWMMSMFSVWLTGIVPSGFRNTIASQPWILQVIEVIVLSDLIIYWAHRLQHRWDFLWRFHKVHHSAQHMDWLAAHREHPLDSIYTIGLINLPAFIFGFPLDTIAGLIAFRGIWAIYIHSNVRLKLGPLRMLIGSPELHHWHHDLERDRGNYANISPLMDVIFGTYVCPDGEPEKFGIKEEFPSNYLMQMVKPLLPSRRNRYQVHPEECANQKETSGVPDYSD